MILAYVGTPGMGKTYEAVKAILDNLKLGRQVFTNIDGMNQPLCREAIKNYCGISEYALTAQLHFLTTDESLEFWEHVCPGSLVVLDEVHKLFSNKDHRDQKNKHFANWASTHRHSGNDVILITQHVEKIESHVRSLIEYSYLFRKVNFFGGLVTKKYLVFVHADCDCLGEAIFKHKRTYDPIIFRCYQSYISKDTKELGIIAQVNILRHPIIYAVAISICVSLFCVTRAFTKGGIFGKPKTSILTSTANASELPHDSTPNSSNDITAHSTHLESTPKLTYKSYKLKTATVSTGKTINDVYIIFDNELFKIAEFPHEIYIQHGKFYANLPVHIYNQVTQTKNVTVEDEPCLTCETEQRFPFN